MEDGSHLVTEDFISNSPTLLIDPQFYDLRGDVRFRELIKKTGVTDNFSA